MYSRKGQTCVPGPTPAMIPQASDKQTHGISCSIKASKYDISVRASDKLRMEVIARSFHVGPIARVEYEFAKTATRGRITR